jgi:5-methylcytosine-specific restriction endonuclease McrA
MPSRPKRFGAVDRKVARKVYDQRRGSAASRGYNTAWVKASNGHKAKHPLCIGCLALGRTTAVYVTDHVVPGTSGTPEFWNSDRWQSACKWHHDTVKQRLEQMYARGEIGIESLWLDSPVAVALSKRLGGE